MEITEEKSLQRATLKELEFYQVLELIAKKAHSDLGKEIILNSEPNDDIQQLQNEHNLIEETAQLLLYDDSLPLEGLSDVRSKLFKAQIENSVLSTGELLAVKDFIRLCRLLKSYFNSRSEKYPYLYDEISQLSENILLEKHINDAIDDMGNVKDNASKELARIRREISSKSAFLRSRLQKIMKKVSEDDMLQEEFTTIRDERFVIPVKVEHKRHIPGIIHGVSQTGATVFLEPMEIFELNNEVSLLKNEENREIYKILHNLTSELRQELSAYIYSLSIASHLDSLIAKANYANEFGCIKPVISEENEIVLQDIRHPLLIQSKGFKNVVPLSISFNSEKRGHLISGPNAGGKTVALKSIGVNVALALSGCFPLGYCKTNYRNIFTSIGDHQSIESDLSTFSSQIKELKQIVDNCTSSSLVLIDEIGSGTDPQEGSALAAGLLDTFLEIKLFFVATTHQSSLKAYSLNKAEIENCSLEFNQAQLKPTYKFLQGIPGNSYAFVLAENLGLSKLVLKRAKKYIGEKQTQLEESIAILQGYRNKAEENIAEAEKYKLKMQKLKEDYEAKLKEIKEKKQIYIRNAREEAAEILQGANALIEGTIKEIREEKKQISVIKKEYFAKKEKIIEKAEKLEPPKEQEEEQLLPGYAVTMEDSSEVGIIISINEKNNSAIVEFNDVKFKVDLSQLRKTDLPKTKKTTAADYIRFDASTRIDLRGKRAEESIREVDDFISQAILGNADQITIIHGKGTGALRKAIQEFLHHHPTIKSYRDGDLLEGGDGVTVVEL
ncbi:MAG: endonuclease MutS2 [Ignavibacteria bacterium]|jgi:DNA mismatch repair protein MutS2|nr:endonuclease MutS2 [Ignavibacteria bacterium]